MRQLLTKDTLFSWDKPQQDAFEKVKDIITQSPGPVLAYYDPDKKLTLQADASKFGLGATLLQDGRPIACASKTLTSAEINYAQIEKELFAILHGCKRFHQYVYGRTIDVETDHKPLVSIMTKPLFAAPARLQRMLLQLQRYNLNVRYIPGKNIPVADTLSRKFVADTYPELSEGMEAHVHTVMSNLPISDRKLQEIRENTNADPQLVILKQTILSGWPRDRKSCPPEVLDYWNHRDQLSVIDEIIMKGEKIVIPKSLRPKMMDLVHSGHMGVKRARDIIFWPLITSELTEKILTCPVCLERRNSNAKEPLLPRDAPDYPWQVVATDLFQWNNQNFFVIVDFYSRFFEVEKLSSTTSSAVVSKMKATFARLGIPERVISDNGPQYASHEFSEFAKEWDFIHETSSPNHQQANGLAEKYVQIIKRLFSKAKADHRDPYISLLEYRTTPLDLGLSPSELLMGRKLRSILPTSRKHLKPQTPDPEYVREKFLRNRNTQKFHFDKHTRPLKQLNIGDAVRIQQHDRSWQPGIIKARHNDRSYIVNNHLGSELRRNRRHLIQTPINQI